MRTSGILLPIFSLPGGYGIGCFDCEAYKFIDRLKQAHQRYWQILPLGPTSYGDSPYQSFSTFAGNPYFISLDELVEKDWLSADELPPKEENTTIDYAALYNTRFTLLKKAFQRSNITADGEFQQFIQEKAYWLNDYALFMALKDFFSGNAWQQWPEDIRLRWQNAIDYYTDKLQENIQFYKFLQFIFLKQWKRLKAYANAQGIDIIGDIPIYVAYDSADTWANPYLFQFNEKLEPTAVAGCPPDGFSADGQLWGNPLYNWPVHEQQNFSWWISRIASCFELYDVVRIDHFRGFDEYYSIPYGNTTARGGHWEKGPGMKLFHQIKASLGDKKIIAEDLGYLTDSVRQLVKDTGYPGMKVLEFAFDSRDSSGANNYLPHNYDRNCIVYTGTHDNETMLGWFKSILPEEKDALRRYLCTDTQDDLKLLDKSICLAMQSVADTCIIPMQDWLGLDNCARINKPSTLGGNWCWKMTTNQQNDALMAKIARITAIYGRTSDFAAE